MTHRGRNNEEDRNENEEVCDDLWVCLICGFTGCGRSNQAHIYSHYESSLHTYALNTSTKQVWDFAGDGFVHRLILNNSDTDSNEQVSAAVSTLPAHSTLNGNIRPARIVTATASTSSAALDNDSNGAASSLDAMQADVVKATQHDYSVSAKGSRLVNEPSSTRVHGSGGRLAYSTHDEKQRLIYNNTVRNDITEETERATSGMSTKVIEVANPSQQFPVRDPFRAPLSSEDEERLIHRKLEQEAHLFNEMLAHHMMQNRLLFEKRLQRIRESVSQASSSDDHAENVQKQTSSGEPLPPLVKNPSSDVSVAMRVSNPVNGPQQFYHQQQQKRNWREVIKSSLDHEFVRLSKQCDAVRVRLDRTKKDVEGLEQMNASLILNQREWQRRLWHFCPLFFKSVSQRGTADNQFARR